MRFGTGPLHTIKDQFLTNFSAQSSTGTMRYGPEQYGYDTIRPSKLLELFYSKLRYDTVERNGYGKLLEYDTFRLVA